MAKKVFVTGTGTDIGKTYISGLLLKAMKEYGLDAGYYKAAMSGNDRDEDGNLIPGDALCVKTMSGIPQPLEEMCPYIYERAYSPHLASRIEGGFVEMEVVKEGFAKASNSHDYILMEGSGGILCPIKYEDGSEIWLEDFIKEFDLGSILIADAGLGTINSVVLTVHYMRSQGLPVKAIIFNNWHPGNEMEEDNLLMCQAKTGLPVIACVKEGDTEIDIDKDTLTALFD